MRVLGVLRTLLTVKVKRAVMSRCVSCDLPLGITGMGPTRESARGPIHTLCIPTWVRNLGEEAVQAFLTAAPAVPMYERPATPKVVGMIYGPVHGPAAPRA